MPPEEHMEEVSWESSEKFKESYSQDVSLNRELMTKVNKQRDLFCPWAGGVPFVGRRPWSWDTVVLAGLFQDELPSWRHQQGNGRMVIVWCRPHMGVMRRGLPRLPPGNQPPEGAGEGAAAAAAPRPQYRAPYQWPITASSSVAGTQLGSLRCTGPAPPT
ncbi:uncharacterized protein LOC131423076 isoform X1 [Diceros bicornis minor]|uniref:uncharacterized protein LOC131423076 isoform X1 n=1 Tax=Diceros bicornis minor TaxID=77932 RepID=UPI0026ED5A73|nr:uncharacterized protein LOC131423076 isoform X1 [Diceros bicornis minor]